MRMLVFIRGLTLLFPLAFAQAEDTYKDIFKNLFPNPHVLNNDLYRVDDLKKRVYLNNISEVRDLSSSSGDTHWKFGSESVFRSAFFGQPKSGLSIEYWTRTLKKPRKKTKTSPSTFSDDEVMEVAQLSSFSQTGPSRDVLQIRSLNFEQAYYLYCVESFKTKTQALKCLYVDLNFCLLEPHPLKADAVVKFSSESMQVLKEIYEKDYSKHWPDVDSLFRSQMEVAPPLETTVATDDFSSLEIGRVQQACQLLVSTSQQRDVKDIHDKKN